jgi:predicted aspartyl protease
MRLPFDPNAGLITVSTLIWGPKGDILVWLALDTGASQSMISWARLIMAGCDPAKVKARERIITGSGVEFAPVLKLKKIQSLHIEKRNFPILCHTLPPGATVDGLLGLDFLRKKRLVLDFRKGLIEIE